MNVIHGHATKHGQSPTYRTWSNMRDRCSNPKHKYYPHYGGRGIVVCERWQEFAHFLADMGEKPAGMSIERKDTNGPYSPANCEWLSVREQSKNMRVSKLWSVNGITYNSMTEASFATGIPRATIGRRVKLGVAGYSSTLRYADGIQRASYHTTHKEQKSNRRYCVFLSNNGKTQTLTQWSVELGIALTTIEYRIKNGWPVEKVLSQSRYSKHGTEIRAQHG